MLARGPCWFLTPLCYRCVFCFICLFSALLFGGLRESQQDCSVIELKDTPAAGFHHLLKYIYTGRIYLSDLTVSFTLALLVLLCLCPSYWWGHRHYVFMLSVHLCVRAWMCTRRQSLTGLMLTLVFFLFSIID